MNLNMLTVYPVGAKKAGKSGDCSIASAGVFDENNSSCSRPVVCVTHGRPTATSTTIAEKFGKRHDAVLRAIRNLECSEEFWLRNFVERDYVDERGKSYPMFEITRDGFAFLAMGFTGKRAAEWKERFIAAFNQQADELSRLHLMHASPNWQQARLDGKSSRKMETDVIKAFVRYAKGQGSTGADKYYQSITKAVNRALFFVESAVGKDFRSSLCAEQLASLAMAERIVERALREAMAASMFYRDAYREAASRVRSFAMLVGQTAPGRATVLSLGGSDD
jgi:Rha family phage regulatory protein